MSILRNREIKYYFMSLAIIALIMLVIVYWISPLASLVSAGFAILLLLINVYYTKWRYRQLAYLAEYLKKINRGDYSLELRDNTEGELSILKNEIYKTTVTLREQNTALQNEKIYMKDALSDISHQLKTPLTSMFMMTDLLCDGDLPEVKRIEFTDRLRSQLERIQWLVSSLLKLSKLDAGTVQFNKQLVAPKDLLDSVCAPLSITMELKQQQLTMETDDLLFACDRNWTVEALVNILKNCVEHTPEHGNIHIACFTNPLRTTITITDSGSGIAQEDLPYVFNRFYKGKNAGSDSIGIGLAMAYSIISSQGGHIDVRANPSSPGTIFTVRL